MKKIIILLILILSISGCATSTMMPWGIEGTRNSLMKLELGMSKQEVIETMGAPYSREAYSISDGNLEFLIYLTQYTYSGSIPNSDTTPICLLNGRVMGWGRNFYERQKHKYEIEIK